MLLKEHRALISLLKQRSYCTNRKIEGMLEGFAAMNINERLLLANYPRVKHIPSGSAKDPWNTLIVAGSGENNHSYKAKFLLSCSCWICCTFARDLGYQRTLGRQIFARGTAARPREASSPQYAHCLTLFLPITTSCLFDMTLNTSWQN